MFKIKLINEDGTSTAITHDKVVTKTQNPKVIIPKSHNKLELAVEILSIMDSGDTPLLFDSSMKQVSANAVNMKSSIDNGAIELPSDTKAIFFTSGTSGNPTGVIKSDLNISIEVKTHQKWLKEYSFEQCLTTVPFVHIYGFLFGISIPHSMGLEVVCKQDFLPHEILEISAQKPTLCITNPLFIRSMLRINANADLSNSLFISSSGPLESSEAASFEAKFNTTLVQLYGSSETGGIAIRRGDTVEWSLLDGVDISCDNDGIMGVSSPFVSSYTYNDKLHNIVQPFNTTDIIELCNGGFRVIGRASEIVKIGGKRLSIIEMERFVESFDDIDEALFSISYTPSSLRGEKLSLSLVANEQKVDKAKLKKDIHDHFGGVHIESKIYFVDQIPKTSLGKKIRENISL
jgi:acyl-coenzyme A synthetase/AMP-(fatty) acid ligase